MTPPNEADYVYIKYGDTISFHFSVAAGSSATVTWETNRLNTAGRDGAAASPRPEPAWTASGPAAGRSGRLERPLT